MIQRPDGPFTANAEEMDKLLFDQWMPIFRMYAESNPPPWESFKEQYGYLLPSGVPMVHAPVIAETLRYTLGKMSNNSCGLDGWRVAEAKSLPDFLLERLAELFNTIEEVGLWPEALAQGTVQRRRN